MSYCPISLKGIASDCSTSKGGIRKIYIGSYIDNPFTVSGSTISGFNSAITEVYEYAVRKNTSSMTSTLNVDAANGVNYVSTELAMSFLKMTKDKREEVAQIAQGDMFVVVEDANGVFYGLGEEPVICSAATGQTGLARTDKNGYDVTLTAEESSFPMMLDDTAITALEALVK